MLISKQANHNDKFNLDNSSLGEFRSASLGGEIRSTDSDIKDWIEFDIA